MASRSRIRSVRAACSAIATVFLFAATARPQADSLNPQPATASFVEYTDEAGRQVRVPRSVQRIVSLAPSLTETLYALGAQDRLVGDTDFCDYPAEAQKKTKVGGAINPSIEQIAALRPDLVLVTKSLNRYDTVRALDDLHIAAYATDPHTVDDVISSAERLAGVLGLAEAGHSLAQDLRRRLAELESRLAASPPRRVLFVVWSEPLISVGKKTFIADALRRAGAVSVIDAAQDWPQVSLEEVVHVQPEVLVFSASHSEIAERDFRVLATRPGWRDLEAVRNARFAVISDAVNRPAPRLISAIAELARQLHPQAFIEQPISTLPPSPSALLLSLAPSLHVEGASTCSR